MQEEHRRAHWEWKAYIYISTLIYKERAQDTGSSCSTEMRGWTQRLVTEVKMWSWIGPVHYLPMYLVLKLESANTPFHKVTNSFYKGTRTMESLKCILAKGQTSLQQ